MRVAVSSPTTGISSSGISSDHRPTELLFIAGVIGSSSPATSPAKRPPPSAPPSAPPSPLPLLRLECDPLLLRLECDHLLLRLPCLEMALSEGDRLESEPG